MTAGNSTTTAGLEKAPCTVRHPGLWLGGRLPYCWSYWAAEPGGEALVTEGDRALEDSRSGHDQ